MTILSKLTLAAIAATIGLTGLSAAPAAAHSKVTIDYRDNDRHLDRRHDRYERYDRHNRHDRRDWRKHERRQRIHAAKRQKQHCWREVRWDRQRHQRYRVTVCR